MDTRRVTSNMSNIIWRVKLVTKGDSFGIKRWPILLIVYLVTVRNN